MTKIEFSMASDDVEKVNRVLEKDGIDMNEFISKLIARQYEIFFGNK